MSEHFNPVYSIQGQLVAKKKNKNFNKYYKLLEKIGMFYYFISSNYLRFSFLNFIADNGSISTINKVERRKTLIDKIASPEKQSCFSF